MIETLAAAAALLLAASGAAKLRRPAAAATLVLRLLRRPAGTSRRAARSAVRVVGAGEFAVGAAVLVFGSRPALALLAAAYLAFAAVAVAVLRAAGAAGGRIPCGCFGNADSPLGPAHLVLDVLACLAALAAVVRPPGVGAGLFDGGATTAVAGSMQAVLLAALGYLAVTSLPALLAARRALAASPTAGVLMLQLVLVETVLLAVLTVLVAGLLRAYGTVLQRLHQLDGGGTPAGGRQFDLLPLARPMPSLDVPAPSPAERSPAEFGPAHDIAGETLDGQLVSARISDVEHDTLLLFLSSGCSSCEVFWTELAQPVPLPAGTRLIVVPQGPREESRHDLLAMAPAGLDVIMSSDAWRDYEVPGSPHVAFVDGRTGRIRGEGTGQSLRQVCELLARSTGDAGFGTTASMAAAGKPTRDAEQEALVDRELLAAGIVPGDPRLYGGH